MNLVYTAGNPVRRRTSGGQGAPPDWTRETNSLCSVSCQNLVVFSSALPEVEHGMEANRIFCLDLNSPWDSSLVCTLPAPATSLAWDGSGSKFSVGDAAGNVSVWKMSAFCFSEWEEVYSSCLPHERIISTGFFSSARVVRLNSENKDSGLYNDKFQFGPQSESFFESEVCIFVTSSGLLFAVLLNESPPLTALACVGRSRSHLSFVDTATSTSGDFLLAACGAETPVTVYRLTCSLTPQEGLQVHLTNHSSFCVTLTEGSDPVRISALRFVLTDCSDAVAVGVEGDEGGKVRMWELDYAQHTCHKLFTQQLASPKRKLVPTWRYCSEFSGGGAKLNMIATPRSSVVGGDKPSCYIVVGFEDGTIQCLIRDSLQQIASVELPRPANTNLDNSKDRVANLTICDMSFTSTGTCLVVTDSMGQLYLYRMSPIADPGGPYVVPYLVTMYEYCLVSGKDWWDLALAAAETNIQSLIDRLEESFSRQPTGVQNFYFYRYMAIKASLCRLCPHSQFRAADTLAILMLKSIYGDLSSLLSAEGDFTDQDPVEKLSAILRSSPANTPLDTMVATLISAGFIRDLSLSSDVVQSIQQLGNWVITLALHFLSAVPEFKTRRGPGFWLMQEGWSTLIRDILVMLRLWALPKAGFITREKELDLNSKLFSMICRLRDTPEDESLLDECLILPSLVIVPGLDVMVAPSGVLAGLQAGMNLPLAFTFGVEPSLGLPAQPIFLEGLPYHEDNRWNTFDTIRKTALGRNPTSLRRCNRCRSNTQGTPGKTENLRSWEKRWSRNCCCGGTWKLLKNGPK